MSLEVNTFTLAGNDIEVVDQYARDKIEEIITSEVTKEYVDNADTSLQNQINALPTKTYVDDRDRTLFALINALPTKTYVDNADASLQNQINALPTKTYVDNADVSLQNQINALPTKTYVDNVDASLQNQINGKQDTITGAASTVTSTDLTAARALYSNANGKIAASTVTSTELGRLSGVTSAIQTQIDGKQATITGAASTVTSNNLTASRALGTNGSGKIAVSSVTTTELDCLHGVTSAIQTQLNNKVETSVFNNQYETIESDQVDLFMNNILSLKVMYIRDNFKINMNNGWTTLTKNGVNITLPSKYRPLTDMFLTAALPGGQFATLKIETTGKVSIWLNTAITTAYTLRFNLLYI